MNCAAIASRRYRRRAGDKEADVADEGFDDLVAVYRRADRSVRRATGAATGVAIFAVLSLVGAALMAVGAFASDDEAARIGSYVAALGAALSAALLWAVSAALEVLASQLEVTTADTDDEEPGGFGGGGER
jgi:hypothetical protein